MDIEGYELSALESAKRLIQKCRPVLSICAYHKWDDLISISSWIYENLENYDIAVRKYPAVVGDYADHFLQIGELVMYGIPKEKSNI